MSTILDIYEADKNRVSDSDLNRVVADGHGLIVVKHNDLIQQSRFGLSAQEQKIILYLVSKIKPEDVELREHSFSIPEFCRICGINTDSGQTYRYLKSTIKSLADKSAWIKTDDNTETLVRWINKAWIINDSGNVKIRLDDDLKPYLLQLREFFTVFELQYTLAMRSQYSIRIYELLKSNANKKRVTYDIDVLKTKLNATNYTRFPDFRRFVVEKALTEINCLTDLSVTYEITQIGRKYDQITFTIKIKKTAKERLESWENIEKALNSPKRKIIKGKTLGTPPQTPKNS